MNAAGKILKYKMRDEPAEKLGLKNKMNFSKKALLLCFTVLKCMTNLNITKNDYDEDGRNEKLYRELSGGARQ